MFRSHRQEVLDDSANNPNSSDAVETPEAASTFQQDLKRAIAARSNSIKGYREDLPGIFFRSRWEANYARYLNWLKAKGEIDGWSHEPDTFWFEKIRRGVRSYMPDFKVWKGESVHYVEVKGWLDPKSKTKLKRMRIYHSKVDLRLVDEKSYRDLEREMMPLIPTWEPPPPRPKRAKAVAPVTTRKRKAKPKQA